jgi:hypothetical protein
MDLRYVDRMSLLEESRDENVQYYHLRSHVTSVLPRE